MLSAAAAAHLDALGESLRCRYKSCGGLLRNPVTLPCGHHFCRECAIEGIDLYDGCTVCDHPCWGKEARPNHALARIAEKYASLREIGAEIQALQEQKLQQQFQQKVKQRSPNQNGLRNSSDANNKDDSRCAAEKRSVLKDASLDAAESSFMKRNGVHVTTAGGGGGAGGETEEEKEGEEEGEEEQTREGEQEQEREREDVQEPAPEDGSSDALHHMDDGLSTTRNKAIITPPSNNGTSSSSSSSPFSRNNKQDDDGSSSSSGSSGNTNAKTKDHDIPSSTIHKKRRSNETQSENVYNSSNNNNNNSHHVGSMTNSMPPPPPRTPAPSSSSTASSSASSSSSSSSISPVDMLVVGSTSSSAKYNEFQRVLQGDIAKNRSSSDASSRNASKSLLASPVTPPVTSMNGVVVGGGGGGGATAGMKQSSPQHRQQQQHLQRQQPAPMCFIPTLSPASFHGEYNASMNDDDVDEFEEESQEAAKLKKAQQLKSTRERNVMAPRGGQAASTTMLYNSDNHNSNIRAHDTGTGKHYHQPSLQQQLGILTSTTTTTTMSSSILPQPPQTARVDIQDIQDQRQEQQQHKKLQDIENTAKQQDQIMGGDGRETEEREEIGMVHQQVTTSSFKVETLVHGGDGVEEEGVRATGSAAVSLGTASQTSTTSSQLPLPPPLPPQPLIAPSSTNALTGTLIGIPPTTSSTVASVARVNNTINTQNSTGLTATASSSSPATSSSSLHTTTTGAPHLSIPGRSGGGGANRAKMNGGQVVFCGSGITTAQDRHQLRQAAAILRGRVEELFNPETVTHVVMAVNPKDSTGPPNHKPVCPRTLKYIQGVLCGCWIVSFEWVKAVVRESEAVVKGGGGGAVGGLQAGHSRVDEARYEIARDKSAASAVATAALTHSYVVVGGGNGGGGGAGILSPSTATSQSLPSAPILGRQACLENRLPLLSGVRIYMKEPLCRLTVKDLGLALRCAGAIIETHDPALVGVVGKTADEKQQKKSFATGPSSSSEEPHQEENNKKEGAGAEKEDVLVLTSFDPSICSPATLESLRATYTPLGITVVDQLWFLDTVSNWGPVDKAYWGFDGLGTKSLSRGPPTTTTTQKG